MGRPGVAEAVSVVLATYRRPRSLERLLTGLAAQSRPPDEVVVVDNDGAGGGAAVAERFAPRLPLRYLVEPTPGASHARNAGVRAAAGPLVALTDDDVVPAPGWLDALLAPLVAGSADVVGGRVVLDPAVPRPRWFDEAGLGGYLTHFDPAQAARPLGDDEYVVTANAACRRDLLLRVGGLRPDLGPRGGRQLVADDVRLTRDLRAAGARLAYAPEAVVVHELPAQRMRRGWLLRRAYLQGRSDWALDRAALSARRLHGARVAASWLRTELRRRSGEGWRSSAVRFHAACDVVRTLGALHEAASWYVGSHNPPPT